MDAIAREIIGLTERSPEEDQKEFRPSATVDRQR
jgi:hypothetical protein